MKDLLELMKTRRSVRKYKPDMIPQDVLVPHHNSRNLFRHRKKLAVTYYHCCHPTRKCVTKISEMNRKIRRLG